MCAGGCTRAFAVVLLLIATAACAIHFISPYWAQITGLSGSLGLWGQCLGELDIGKIKESLDACAWFSDNDFAWEKNLASWFYACQGLSGFGILFMLLAVPTGCGALCCCKSDRLAYFTGVTTIFACLLQAVSIGVWGYFIHDAYDVMPFVNKTEGKADWGYYLGIGGVILGWVAGGMFFCSRSKASRYA